MRHYLVKMIIGSMGVDVIVQSNVENAKQIYDEIIRLGGFSGPVGWFRADTVMGVLDMKNSGIPVLAQASNIVPFRVVGGKDANAGSQSEDGPKEVS